GGGAGLTSANDRGAASASSGSAKTSSGSSSTAEAAGIGAAAEAAGGGGGAGGSSKTSSKSGSASAWALTPAWARSSSGTSIVCCDQGALPGWNITVEDPSNSLLSPPRLADSSAVTGDSSGGGTTPAAP